MIGLIWLALRGIQMKDLLGRISVDPEICHGQPCVKGTRIMVYIRAINTEPRALSRAGGGKRFLLFLISAVE